MNKAFNIKAVAEQTGVSVHVLRQWERRYGVPSPNRGGNGYRLYGEADIADVLAIKRQIESGVSPAQASAWLRQNHPGRSLAAQASTDTPLDEYRAALENAFLRVDEFAARQVLDQSFAFFSMEQATLQVIQPAMEMLGTLWMRGEVSIAQEHFASNLVRQKLIALIQAQGTSPAAGFHFVAASAPAEEHELGLLMLVLVARHQGWGVSYLGQRTPLVELADFAREQKSKRDRRFGFDRHGFGQSYPMVHGNQPPRSAGGFGGRLLNLVPRLRDHLPGSYLGEDIAMSLKTLTTQNLAKKYWTPSKKSLKAALMLRDFRLKIANETVNQLADQSRIWGLGPDQLVLPTLYLLDTFACAMAYDAPELVDSQNEWLGEAMPSRRINPQMLNTYLQAFQRILEKNLGKDKIESIVALLDRLKS